MNSRIGNWTADIHRGDRVVGTRSMTVEPILNGRFHSCRFVDQMGAQTVRGWLLVSLAADGTPIAAKSYDSLGRNHSWSASLDDGQLTLNAPNRSYRETIGRNGPIGATITDSGQGEWTLRDFRKATARVTQQADSPPEANSPMAAFASRIGTWHGDVLFLGRKVFEVEYSWSWDLNGRLNVQHRKAGGELVVDTWSAADGVYESTVFTTNGEIQIRRLTEHESSRDVVLDKADDLGVSRISESLNTTGESFVRGLRENGSTVWDCPKMVRVSPIPLHLEAEVGLRDAVTIPDSINFREAMKYNESGPVDLF
ncbi:MAG: hypothetical protein KDA92_26490, partial [Planctomycetales bacterium]|nr:hypothetical protein [Planctomycetales bacterium]